MFAVRRVLFFLIIGLCLSACATTDPQVAARDLYRDYYHACQKSKDSTAGVMIARDRVEPCPDFLDAPRDVVLVARRDAVTLWKDASWHLDHEAFSPESPQFALKKLKYAIFYGNLDQLSQLFALDPENPSLRRWIQGSIANEIYAGLAMTPSPRMTVQKGSVSCEIAGHLLQLKYVDHAWVLTALPE